MKISQAFLNMASLLSIVFDCLLITGYLPIYFILLYQFLLCKSVLYAEKNRAFELVIFVFKFLVSYILAM